MRKQKSFYFIAIVLLAFAGIAGFAAGPARAAVFDLQTGVINKTMPDGQVITFWGFGPQGGAITVPGPVLTVPPGDTTLTINLQNNLTIPVSLVIPGLSPAPADISPVRLPDGRARSFVKETAAGGASTYTWTAKPGTYLYQSGTHPALQVQMGLYGAVKSDFAAGQAYSGVPYDLEVLLLFSEVDPFIHQAAATGNYGPAGTIKSSVSYNAKYFLINGEAYQAGLPPVPAGAIGQTVLLRLLNAGLNDYVPTTPSVYFNLVAEDGNLYRYPKRQYSVLLPAGKTFDAAMVASQGGDIPLFDRGLNLSNNLNTPGGMLTYLRVGPLATTLQAMVAEYYNDILARAAEPGGAEGWTAEIQRIASLGIDVKEGFIAVGKSFFNSAEYLARNRTDAEYVTDLYQSFLNRAPDQTEIDFWVGYLTGGASRNIVLNFFVFSPEFQAYMAGVLGASVSRPENNLVNDFYRGILSRLPDTTGFNFWLGRMRQAQCTSAQQVRVVSHQIALGFILSAEYSGKARTNAGFIEDMYDAVMRRHADPTEVNYWVGLLTAGTMTREQVLQFFVNAPEFQNRVTAVINAGCL